MFQLHRTSEKFSELGSAIRMEAASRDQFHKTCSTSMLRADLPVRQYVLLDFCSMHARLTALPAIRSDDSGERDRG